MQVKYLALSIGITATTTTAATVSTASTSTVIYNRKAKSASNTILFQVERFEMRKMKVSFNELEGKKHRIKVLFPLKNGLSSFGFWKEYLAGELASLLLAEGDKTAADRTPLAWL